MRHRPHVYCPPPWNGDVLVVDDSATRHLSVVLRLREGAPVDYTDGMGIVGAGTWVGHGIERGGESMVPRPISGLHLAVAPPKARDRQRFIVEKTQELGVPRLSWIRTERTEGRPPSDDKASAWAIGALEQSRGAWSMAIDEASLEDIHGAIVATQGGVPMADIPHAESAVIVVGPEGGLTDEEESSFTLRVRLAPTVLRTETAAIVAASVWVDRTT